MFFEAVSPQVAVEDGHRYRIALVRRPLSPEFRGNSRYHITQFAQCLVPLALTTAPIQPIKHGQSQWHTTPASFVSAVPPMLHQRRLQDLARAL